MNKKKRLSFVKLPKEIQALWEVSKQQKLNSDFMGIVQDKIRRARNNERAGLKRDSFGEKLERHGNGGGWAREQIR